ncbi:F-Box Only Protein 15 [Manis pentadactyla]|nr:F-Box Only Protein 15 [Manis pentadactyla]
MGWYNVMTRSSLNAQIHLVYIKEKNAISTNTRIHDVIISILIITVAKIAYSTSRTRSTGGSCSSPFAIRPQSPFFEPLTTIPMVSPRLEHQKKNKEED